LRDSINYLNLDFADLFLITQIDSQDFREKVTILLSALPKIKKIQININIPKNQRNQK